MQEQSTYIKLYRSILEWRWYKTPHTLQTFIWLLLSANIKPYGFQGFTIKRGEVATSYATIASENGITPDQARTAISHLKKTGEITVKRHSKFLQIAIVNYEMYQGKNPNQIPIKSHSLPNHSPITSQSNPNNQRMEECKNGKNGRKKRDTSPPALREWEKSIPERFRGRFETERDWKIFTGEEVGEDE